MEWLKEESEEYETDITDKRELLIRDVMSSILTKLPFDMEQAESDFTKDLLLLMLREYELFVDSFQFACKNFKDNAENAALAQTMGFESNRKYNEIMFLREIIHTVNMFNDMGDIVRLYSKNPETATGRLANSAVLQQSFRFAVFPKQLITFNPMQYIKLKRKAEEMDLFSEEDMGQSGTQPISHDDYEKLIAYLEKKNPPAVLPIQIAYYAGLRIGEVCGLTWQDINLEEQYLTVKRSARYDVAKHKTIIGPTKRKKVRTVDFGDTLTAILKKARKEQLKNQMQYGELYHRNYYKDVQELLGHSDVSTTMNVYAHATREAKRTSARLLDKVAGND